MPSITEYFTCEQCGCEFAEEHVTIGISMHKSCPVCGNYSVYKNSDYFDEIEEDLQESKKGYGIIKYQTDTTCFQRRLNSKKEDKEFKEFVKNNKDNLEFAFYTYKENGNWKMNILLDKDNDDMEIERTKDYLKTANNPDFTYADV